MKNRPIMLWSLREAIDLNKDAVDMDGNPLPEKLVPKLRPFTRPQFRDCVGACLPVCWKDSAKWVANPDGPTLGDDVLWFLCFEWPTTSVRQKKIREKLREARDLDGQISRSRGGADAVPEISVEVTEYQTGENPEDPPVLVVAVKTMRELAWKIHIAGWQDDEPADIEEET